MAEKSQLTVECGFCLRKNEALPEPKALPCTHVHCLQCLNGYFEENKLLLCPVQDCGEVFVGSPDSLPSHDLGGDDCKWCDVCVRKKVTKEEATSYCTVCSKKLCDSHRQSHDDTMIDHPNISIREYRAQAAKMQAKNCTKHEEHPYVVGCKICTTLCCLECLSDMGSCDNGASHSLLPLDKLVAALTEEDISAKMMAKEDQYEKLFKETSKVRVDYDNKTAEMVQQIRDTRDAQIDALKLKYQKLEDEVIEKRQKSRVDLAEFMEVTVLKKWTQLRNRRKVQETRVKCSHQVDIVKGIKELKKEMQKFVVEELPKLELTDELQLKALNECRVIELEITSSEGIAIDSQLTFDQPSPQSVTLLKSIQLPAYPVSVCQYKGSTYVGLNNKSVTRIDNNYQLYNSFISTSGTLESISVYKDRFYTLSLTNPLTVGVYDMSGGRITSWTHPYHSRCCNILTVAADQVVVADPTNQRITIYSLTGEFLRHIFCPLLSDIEITMCAVDNTSVVISNYVTSKVFRVNITTGEVLWTLSDVNKPLGLIRYGSYILLVAHKNKTIYILDTKTGNVVSDKVADDAIVGNFVYSLEVDGTTLIVPHGSPNRLLFYQLN